jgi:hypothetical protein
MMEGREGRFIFHHLRTGHSFFLNINGDINTIPGVAIDTSGAFDINVNVLRTNGKKIVKMSDIDDNSLGNVNVD